MCKNIELEKINNKQSQEHKNNVALQYMVTVIHNNKVVLYYNYNIAM